MSVNKVVYGTTVLVDLTEDTVNASDLAEGITAHGANGEFVTGTIKEGVPVNKSLTPELYDNGSVKMLRFNCVTNDDDKIVRAGTQYYVAKIAEAFGDATIDDVAKGKTFTSANGVKLTGTMESSGTVASDNNCEAYHITSTDETINFKGTGTVKVYGYGYKQSTYMGTTYAFVGDGYYSGYSYGTPTKTSASFSISNGKLSGLPRGLTKVDLLVEIGV